MCVVALFPVYWMVVGSFQPEDDTLSYRPSLFFKGFTFSAIHFAFKDQPLASWIVHSFEVSAVTVVITVVLAIPGAYLLSRLRLRGSGAFGFLLLFTQLMPGAMIVVPELEWFRSLHGTNNLLALGVVYAAFSTPLGCWILKSSFDNVPNDIVDAGFVDGCSQMGTLRRVLIPLALGVVAVMVVAFFGAGTTTCSLPPSLRSEPSTPLAGDFHVHRQRSRPAVPAAGGRADLFHHPRGALSVCAAPHCPGPNCGSAQVGGRRPPEVSGQKSRARVTLRRRAPQRQRSLWLVCPGPRGPLRRGAPISLRRPAHRVIGSRASRQSAISAALR